MNDARGHLSEDPRIPEVVEAIVAATDEGRITWGVDWDGYSVRLRRSTLLMDDTCLWVTLDADPTNPNFLTKGIARVQEARERKAAALIDALLADLRRVA